MATFFFSFFFSLMTGRKDLQSINSKYKCFAISDADLMKPSRRKVGKGGVALFWKKELDKYVSLLNIEDDRLSIVFGY